MRPRLIFLFAFLAACSGDRDTFRETAAEECTDTHSAAWTRQYYEVWCEWAGRCAEAEGMSEAEVADYVADCLQGDEVGGCADPCGDAEQACLSGFAENGACTGIDGIAAGLPAACYEIRECE